MTSKVVYKGQLHTEATHSASGNTISTDAPEDNRGKGEAFSPSDLTATSLASCMLTIMGIRAEDNEFSIEGAEAEVTKIMAEEPRCISEIIVKITMPSGQEFDDDQKELIREACTDCPVCRSLHPGIKVSLDISYDEE